MSDITTWSQEKKAAFAAEILGEATLSNEQRKAILTGMGIGPATEKLRQLMATAPGQAALPTLMAAPPAIALSAANAATSIAGSIRVSYDDAGKFRYLGIDKPKLNNLSFTSSGRYTNSTDSPWAAEFILDTVDATGRFEIIMLGKAAAIRVLVNGQYVTAAATFKPVADGNIYRGLVTLGAPGTYRIRLEMDAQVFFRGINTGPTDTVRATPPKRFRIVVAGDSFTEPTVRDTSRVPTQWDGWVQKLCYLLDADCISCGSGGTGYVNPGTAPRVKLLDRIADVMTMNPDIIMLANGINDYTNPAATVGAEALACMQYIRAQDATLPIAVVSPFWKAGYFTYPSGLLAASDAILAASLAVSGTTWIDLLMMAVEGIAMPAAGTLAAAAAAGATSISSSVSIPVGMRFRIGNSANSEVRKCISVTGAGPYTLGFNGTDAAGGGSVLLNNHTSGEPVTPCGDGFVTGGGNQGAPSATRPGNADRYTSDDATHYTIAGGENLAHCAYREWKRVVLALP